MRIGCLTFHAAYNFGSVLQAYALQEFLKENYDCKYEIINFRSDIQKKFYSLVSKYHSFGRNIYNIIFIFKLNKKKIKFENFINTKLDISKEINSVKQENIDNYDLVIVGGDQPWNMDCIDFSDAYYLPFEKKNNKFISYGISMGGFEIKSTEQKLFLKNNLQKFDYISVREEDTRSKIKEFTNNNVDIHFDPVFLLSKEEWKNKFDLEKSLIKDKYIFVYMLKVDVDMLKKINVFAKKYKYRIILSRPTALCDIKLYSKLMYESGPEDFLHLIYNAEMIFTSSFHGCAFSALFNKKFLAVNGNKDKRISHFLNENNLSSLFVDKDTDLEEKFFKNDIFNFERLNWNIKNNKECVKQYFNRIIK